MDYSRYKTRELYEAIEHVLNRKTMIKTDMERATSVGVESELIHEYGRLVKSVDINRRLLRILENTYHIADSQIDLNDEITMAIKSMGMNLQFQEMRIQQIRDEISKKESMGSVSQ